MRLFLSLWQDGRVSLVSGNNLNEVFLSLDTEGDASRCFIQEYVGPLCLTFKPTIQPEKNRYDSETCEVTRKEPHEYTSKTLAGLFEDGVLSDVELKSQDGKGIACHRAILARSCPFFHAMFTSGMQESSQACVHLQNIRHQIMKAIIDFIYKGSLGDWYEQERALLTEQNKEGNCIDESMIELLKEVYTTADFLSYDALKETCQWCMLDIADLSNNLCSLIEDMCIFAVDNEASILDAGLVIHAERLLRGHPSSMKLPNEILVKVGEYVKRFFGREPYQTGVNGELQKKLKNVKPGLTEEVVVLLEQGASLDDVCALHEMCMQWTPFPFTIEQEKANSELEKMFKWMLQQECVIALRNSEGHTPLYLAVCSMSEALVRLLLAEYSKKNCDKSEFILLVPLVNEKWEEFLAKEWLQEAPITPRSDQVLTPMGIYNYLVEERDCASYYKKQRELCDSLCSLLERSIESWNITSDECFEHEELSPALRTESVNEDFIEAVMREDRRVFQVEFALDNFTYSGDSRSFMRCVQQTAYPVFSKWFESHITRYDCDDSSANFKKVCVR